MNSPEPSAQDRRVEREMRAAVRQQIIAMGLPGNVAAEIVDLAFHATDKAMAALASATEVAQDSRVRMNALLVATSLIDVRMKQARDAANAMAGMLGCEMLHGTVQAGAQSS